MKYLPTIAGIVLGLPFVAFGVMFLLHLIPDQPMPAGTPVAAFMAAFGPTGYMTFVKVFELIGGVLVAIPRTRNSGLLVLGPIIVNIIAFHIFIMKGEAPGKPVVAVVALLAAYLLWVGRKAFAGLLN
jgi:putative oxidoreductase